MIGLESELLIKIKLIMKKMMRKSIFDEKDNAINIIQLIRPVYYCSPQNTRPKDYCKLRRCAHFNVRKSNPTAQKTLNLNKRVAKKTL